MPPKLAACILLGFSQNSKLVSFVNRQKVRCTILEVLTEIDKAHIITLYGIHLYVDGGHKVLRTEDLRSKLPVILGNGTNG